VEHRLHARKADHGIVKTHNLREAHADREMRGSLVQLACYCKRLPFERLVVTVEVVPCAVGIGSPLVATPALRGIVLEIGKKLRLVALAPLVIEDVVLEPD
jgi:hypothetical protein